MSQKAQGEASAATESTVAADTTKQTSESKQESENSAAPASEKQAAVGTSSLLDQAAEGDDGDDSDVNEDAEEKTEKKGTVVYLRGKLKKGEDSTVIYAGVWASQKEDFADKTKTSKIKYETTLSDEQLRAGDIGDTSWDGYFLVNEGPGEDGKPKYSKVKEEGIELSVAPSNKGDGYITVKGSGVNAFGGFQMTGVYNIANRQMTMTKQYEADDSDDDDLEEDTRTQEEQLNEVALLLEDAEVDVSELKSGAHLKKRKASSGVAGGVTAPVAKRERRRSAIRAQNQWRDKLEQAAADGQANGNATSSGSCESQVQALSNQVKACRRGGAAQLMPLLRRLGKFEVTVAILSSTKIGSIINKLGKKHPDVEVKRLAGLLVKKWRAAAAKESS
eukprot:INCI11888.1.p1 GENE.INCI11888.1~~INCI11888.1.p1  ORF type:complete len:391 (+),score=95.08 INCI11888.1:169-1341(+)